MKSSKSVLSSYLLYVCFALFARTLSSANLFSARCRSRCLAKEIGRQNTTECTTNPCLACSKPCGESKLLKAQSCLLFCNVNFKQSPIAEKACKESCKFLKHLRLKGGNTPCAPEVPTNQCVLMRPGNVQVSVPKGNKKSENYTISWNGTWLPGTVFVIFSRQRRKGGAPSKNSTSPNAWREITQTTAMSVQFDVQPLSWHQFRVAAVNQYGSSLFSVPSKFIFINLRNPGPPRDFRVTNMRTVKGSVIVHVSWKKPDSASELPIHRYKLSWSVRHDEHQDDYTDLVVTDKRITGNVHKYAIEELLPNRTYVLEIQAIGRWHRQRLRSGWVQLRIRTPALPKAVEEENGKEPIMGKFKVNTVWKKPKEDLGEPTAATKKETQPKVASNISNSTEPDSMSTTKRKNPRMGAEENYGQPIRVPRFSINIWVTVSIAVIFYL